MQTYFRWTPRFLPIFLLLPLLTWPGVPVSAEGIQPPSSAILNVDAPGASVTVASGEVVFIGGWAADPGQRGTGIDRVEVYLDALPGAGGLRVGTARYGVSRSDVAAAHQRPEWARSGFTLSWTTQRLPPGDYVLYVVASSSTGTSASKSISLTVSSEAPVSRSCALTSLCPALFRTQTGWEIDMGGPGTYFDPFPGSRRGGYY